MYATRGSVAQGFHPGSPSENTRDCISSGEIAGGVPGGAVTRSTRRLHCGFHGVCKIFSIEVHIL